MTIALIVNVLLVSLAFYVIDRVRRRVRQLEESNHADVNAFIDRATLIAQIRHAKRDYLRELVILRSRETSRSTFLKDATNARIVLLTMRLRELGVSAEDERGGDAEWVTEALGRYVRLSRY
jgi:hypothetical protein